MSIRPLNGTVIVRPDPKPQDTLSPGGLIIHVNRTLAFWTGTVVAVGPGVTSQKTGAIKDVGVKPGDRIQYEQFLRFEADGGNMKIEDPQTGEKFVVLEPRDVMGHLVDEE